MGRTTKANKPDKLVEKALLLEELYKRKCENDYGFFAREAWKQLNPFEPLSDCWYIDAICDNLQAVKDGMFNRLIVNQPPRTGKSLFISVMYPVWRWIKEPHIRIVFYSYSFEKLSVAFSLQRRRLIQSPWFQKYWGNNFTLSIDENQKWNFSNDKTGHMTVLSQATGIGGNMLIVDDPHSVEEALSDADRANGVTFFRQGLMSRLDNPQRDPVILVMQRLHDKDVTGVLLADGGWTHLCLPAEAVSSVDVVFPFSKRTVHRNPAGENRLLDPLRLSDDVLKAKKTELGSVGYAGQYMQEPAPAEGAIFNPAWWNWYDDAPPFDEMAITVDATFGSVKESADDVAIQAWGMVGNKSYLVDRDTRKMNFSTTKAAIRSMMKKYDAHCCLIEKKANGAAIIEELRGEFTIIEISPDWGDKVARAQACSPMVEAGLCYLPSKEVWAVKIQNLAAKFPNADKDDIDAMSQYLNWRRKHGAMLGWLKREAERADKGRQPDPLVQPMPGEHPTPAQVMALANEQAGMKPKPKTQERKPVVQQTQQAVCTECGSANLFRSSAGAKCLNCKNVMPTQRIVKGIA